MFQITKHVYDRRIISPVYDRRILSPVYDRRILLPVYDDRQWNNMEESASFETRPEKGVVKNS